jgi:CHAT domain/Inner membrane component of T3SS, cytoplasmic domain
LKIICHGYDWPFPRMAGLWLEPAMAAQSVPQSVQAAVLKLMINRYYEMLGALAEKYRNHVYLADCRGAVGPVAEWFDELHPFNAGFMRAADRFRGTINRAFGISRSRSASGTTAIIAWHPREGATGVTGSAEFDLGSVVTVGRITDLDIVIDDERVSRNHVRLEIRRDNVVFTDLNTTNGTLLDGRRRIGATVWKPGQTLSIGNHELTVEFDTSATAALASRDVTAMAATVAGSAPRVARARPATPPAIVPAMIGKPAAESAVSLRRLELAITSKSIAEISAPAYVVGVFEHINPTGWHGGAVAIDEKLGGMLSTMVQAQMFESHLGEISLIAMPHDRSLTGLIAFAGLGPINAFGPAVLQLVGEKLAIALTDAHVLEFATVPVGADIGLTVNEFLGGFLTGFIRGLAGSKEALNFRKISVGEISPERAALIERELKALSQAGDFAKLGYEIVLSKEDVTAKPAPGSGQTPSAPPASPVYLQVQRTAETTFEYCMLTAELGAAIQLHQQTIETKEQAQAAEMAAKLQQFDATTGASLASLFVPSAMQELICRSLEKPNAHLVIIHDQASSIIPWEAFYFKDHCPALDAGVSRLYRLANRTRGGRPILAHDVTLRMLVVDNPTGDLAGAQNEGDQLAALYEANRGMVKTLKGADATRANVLAELASGLHDILHYAGHADFVETSPEESGLILRDGRLTAADLAKVETAPQMIFLNACQSGRMRGAPGKPTIDVRRSTFAGHVSLAEGFLVNGIANFIGTYWPVDDVAASRFANAFYAGLLAGKPLSVAMREARQAAKTINSRDWANYLHFGDPLYVLRRASSP